MEPAENYEADMEELFKEDFLPFDGSRSVLVEHFRQAIMDNNLERVKEYVAMAERHGGLGGKQVILGATNQDEFPPLFTALRCNADDCFHYLLDSGATSVRASVPKGDVDAIDYALVFEIEKFNWDPNVQSLPNLIFQLGEKRYAGSPIMRLFQKCKWISAMYAKDMVRGTRGRCFKEVIGIAIVLRLNEETEANYQLDLSEIHDIVCEAFTKATPQAIDMTDNPTVPNDPTKLPEPTKMLICQALLIQDAKLSLLKKKGEEINVNADESEAKLKLKMLQHDLVGNQCCFGCREEQKSLSHLWLNNPCSHVVWCRDCKEWVLKMTEGFGRLHTCIICGQVVTSVLPVIS